MYGIVNQAIQGLITENYGAETWKKIKFKCKLEVEFFLSDLSYDDAITYDLVTASSEVLNISADAILESFGEYWVLRTGKEKYGDLMKAGGKDFKDFIKNLPNFHSRIMLIYPKLNPPEFMVEELSGNKLILHYYSSREGLTQFVVGLLKGLAKMYGADIEIKLLSTEKNITWHDLFEIQIN